MKKKKVFILTTGGTIEKSYSESDGVILNKESIFKEQLLSHLRLPHSQVEVEQIMAKDSLEMNDQDRQSICEAIEDKAKHGCPIVVLHGTDTMEVTIRHCHRLMPQPPVTIVFTGAMKPAGFVDSDARQNFTEALYASQIIMPGFYVSFHGKLFTAPGVKKDKDLGTFVVTRL